MKTYMYRVTEDRVSRMHEVGLDAIGQLQAAVTKIFK
jgi:hypothetical protein